MIETSKLQTDQKSIPQPRWERQKAHHEESVGEILDPYLKKRSEQKKDPVLDFLFEYYKFRPSHLKRWSPGIGVVLEVENEEALPKISEFSVSESTAWLNPDYFPQKRERAVRWMLGLLENTDDSKPFYGCFGMHEWAMVYRVDKVRHNQIPLRLSDDEIAEFVESRPLLCTHFDAFRFFTEKAKPLNRNELSRDTFQETEQSGCIHTNMDLYKWAYKLHPWVSGEMVREAFFLAKFARTIDMKASPYDLREYGLEPIKIETEAGRKEYLVKQKEIHKKAVPVRKKLIQHYRKILKLVV